MPQIQYPFIDIAVHPAVRAKFAAGEAIALFSRDMMQVLWANGEGAKLFGYSDIYDLLDNGPERNGVAFRQLAATVRQLETVGDRRSLMMRITAGFSSQAVAAEVSLVEIRRGETVVIFSAPVAANSTFQARIASMLKGFDDPDTHMAVIDDQGAVLTASPGFAALGILPETARALIAAVTRSGEGLIKRPIASGAGYLPAAIGRLSVDPPLNLLFCVETVLGRMDPPQEAVEPVAAAETDNAALPGAPTKDGVEDDVSLPGLALSAEDVAAAFPAETVANEPAALTDEAAGPDLPAAADQSTEDHQAGLPAHLELAADQAEAASTPDANVSDLPQEELAAESETDMPAADFPARDGAAPEASAEETETPAKVLDDAEPTAHENLELAADEATTQPTSEDILAVEPEELASADLAEAAMNDSESEDDVHALAAIDGATADDIEAHASPETTDLESSEEIAAEPETVAVQENHVVPPAFADMPIDQAPEFAPTEQPSENTAAADEIRDGTADRLQADREQHAEHIPAPSFEPEDMALIDRQAVSRTAPETTEPDAFETAAASPEQIAEDAAAADVISHPIAEPLLAEAADVSALEGETGDVPAQAVSAEPQGLLDAASDVPTQMASDAAAEAASPDATTPSLARPETTDLPSDAAPTPVEAAEDAADARIAETISQPQETASDMAAMPTAESGPVESVEQPVDAETTPADQSAPISSEEELAAPQAIMDRPAEDANEASVNAAETAADAAEPAETVSEPRPADDTENAAEAPLSEAPTEAASAEIATDAVEAQDIPPAAIASDLSVAVAPTAENGFQFRRDGRPVRFVWKLDAQGRFSEVSEEFAKTVGPHAGEINGLSYRDLDQLFNLDPSNEIGKLLERRDTWSGRTIRWPVEGTNLVVPVDLAALPTYSRNREFDGFRGFGIIRVADAEEDPHAVGLTLGTPASTDEREQTAETQAPLTDSNPDLPEQPHVGFSEPETISAADMPLDAEDEFRGEVPALRLDSTPLASFSEKIIQLEERRSKGREGLTPNEQNAFREIARRLEPFGKRPNETLQDNEPAAPEENDGDTPDTAEQTLLSAAEEPTLAGPAGEQAEAAEQAPQAAEDSEAAPAHDDAIAESETDAAADTGHRDRDADQDDAASDIGLTASAADQIPLAILIHAGDRLIHGNSEFMRFTGYDSLEALEAAGGLDALIARKEGPHAGVYTIRADGTSVPVSARLQSVRYEGAKLLMLTLVEADMPPAARDEIAEDQEAARKLSALKVEVDELRSILETATDGVVVLDTDGRIRSMNRSASALFNFEDSETRGKPFAMLFAHESQKAVQDYLNGLSGHGVASVLNDGREVIGREASGGFIPLFMTMGRMPGSNSYCAVIRDITQWKRSEEELKAAKRSAETANQHKSDFLARVSHEIRTPLNAIIGFSDMIASEHFGPAGHPRYVEYANDIGRSGRHVLDIVNDLLDISKIEAGEMDLEFAAVGINDCISEAVSLVQPQANTQRVIIRTSLSQSVPDVVADLRSIKQIAINILANAIRFTPSGGQIVVSTAYEPTGSVALRIRDTGVGMSKSELEQAMKPFGQVAPGARKRGEGTGLGLPLTKAMTEANRALFSIQSSPNEGTLVEIVFPPQRVLAD